VREARELQESSESKKAVKKKKKKLSKTKKKTVPAGGGGGGGMVMTERGLAEANRHGEGPRSGFSSTRKRGGQKNRRQRVATRTK